MVCELKEQFNLDDALKYGLLPLRFSYDDYRSTLQSYIDLYLEEEVKM